VLTQVELKSAKLKKRRIRRTGKVINCNNTIGFISRIYLRQRNVVVKYIKEPITNL